MDTLTKKRLLIGTIIILIVINISALSTIAFNKYQQTKNVELKDSNGEYQYDKRDKRQKIYHKRVKYFMKRELSLSDEQFEQYIKLKDINIEKSGFLMQEIGNRKKLIFKEFCKEIQDTLALKQMADEIGSLHAQMQQETLRHFQAIEKMLTPEQFVKFKLMLCDMSNRKGHGFYKKRGERRRGMRSKYSNDTSILNNE